MSGAIETHGAIEPIEVEWDELARRTGASPFLRPGCFSIWWDVFGSGELAVLALRREGRLAGVLPVRRRRGVVSSLTDWNTDHYGPVAEDEAAKRELFAAVFADAPRRIDFSFLDIGSGDLDCLREAAGSYRIASRVLMRPPYVQIDQDWESYWSGLSKNLRGTVRRCRNRLSDRGEVTVDVSDGRDGLDELLEEGFELEASGWKGEEGTAIISKPETRRYYDQMARWAAENGLLRLVFLRIDGKSVAFNFSLETDESNFLVKLGHDAELDSIGPGTVLTAEMVSRAFSLGLRSYEFLGAADRYKVRWSQGHHERVRAQAFAPTVGGRLDMLVQTHGRAVAKRVLRRGG